MYKKGHSAFIVLSDVGANTVRGELRVCTLNSQPLFLSVQRKNTLFGVSQRRPDRALLPFFV